jgi:TPR repeat protein
MPGKNRRKLNNRALEAAHFQKVMKAAERGDLEAQHDLAAFYATDDSLGVKDEGEAVKWYTRAAERGHGQSQYDLGFMLLLGEGAEKDVAKGLWWLEQAVANGWEYAARLLSDVYEEGMFGVAPDREKAAYWDKKAGDFKDRT